ncbi:MAG: hypothetical protein ACE5WD_05510 [Candidatus Aminicenantia bacterium]
MGKDWKNSVWIVLRSILIFLYALFLLWLIPTFFYNYSGDWMKKVADKLSIREMNIR